MQFLVKVGWVLFFVFFPSFLWVGLTENIVVPLMTNVCMGNTSHALPEQRISFRVQSPTITNQMTWDITYVLKKKNCWVLGA